MLQHTENPGLRALLEVNGLKDARITAYHIGFVIGPCINAGGRLDTAKRALSLLLEENKEEALRLAGELKALNEERKSMTLAGLEKAVQLVEESDLKGDKVLVVYLAKCHESLAGIIAGRLRERYHRPVFVLTDGEEGVKGSGRSIEAYPCLRSCASVPGCLANSRPSDGSRSLTAQRKCGTVSGKDQSGGRADGGGSDSKGYHRCAYAH